MGDYKKECFDSKELHRFLSICLDIAEWVDIKKEAETNWIGSEMCEVIGIGCRSLSSRLRKGVRQVIFLQENYHSAKERLGFAETENNDTRNYFIDVFGDEEPYSFNDEDKEKIKAFIGKLIGGIRGFGLG